MSFDMVFRYFKHLGYKVRYVRNITDAGHLENDADMGEDKIAKKARLEQIEPMEVVQRYTVDFHNILNTFNFLPPSIEPTATGHIIEQIELISTIIDNGFAYEVNGSVYFDVHKYNQTNDYGILSKRKLEDLIHNTRELDGQSDKKNPQDFALWKKAEPQHIMRWPVPLERWFPGLAPRVYRNEHEVLRRSIRHSRWWYGFKISASRMRNCPKSSCKRSGSS